MTFALKNKICLVCIKPKESSVQLPAKSKCQCDMMTSCIRKTNCRKTCFYCQQNHHYIFCKLPPAVTCSESIRKQFLKEVARKEKVNKQKTDKKPENFTFNIFYRFYIFWWKVLHGVKMFCSWVLVGVKQNYRKI